MKKIIVISDTHIPLVSKNLPKKILNELKNFDYCLHAGDFVDINFFNELKKNINLKAVAGNMDDLEIKKILPSKQIIQIEEIKIGLIHGKGSPLNLIEYIQKEFENEFKEIDIFVFGHSHVFFDKEIDNKIYFNPGSPTDYIYSQSRSYGIMTIDKKNIRKEIIKIE